MDGFTHYQRSPILIIPSQMEVAPPHRTVDTTQKRILSKNTKETHYQMSPLLKPPSQIRKIFYANIFGITLVNQTAFSKYMPYRKNFPDFCKHFPNFCKHFANFCKHFPDSMLGKPHRNQRHLYLGIAQIAIRPPRTQTGTLGHFFSGTI